MQKAKIIVTGGSGFIGSNLVRKLSHTGNSVIVIDDLSTGNFINIEDLEKSGKIEFIKGSITDIGLLHENFKGIDYVFHQAAIPSVPRSVKDPIGTNNANINGTLNVLIACKENNIKKVVCASSSSAYGNTPTLPKKENMLPQPLSPYAVAKLTGEYYCQAFTEVFGLKSASLRYFNVYGPRQNPESEYAAVIPKFVSRVLTDKRPIVYGDGEQTRDFTYVEDVVNANILAAESQATGVFNIGSGKNISINSLARLIMELCGKNLELEHSDPALGDVKDSLADISKAAEKFGYTPNFDLTKGLKETIKWIQNPMYDQGGDRI